MRTDIFIFCIFPISFLILHSSTVLGVKFGLFHVIPVLKGEMIFMMCRVYESQNLNSDIKFVHKTQTDNTTVCDCVQRGDTCNCHSTQSYICRCGAQTNNASSEYKDYTVMKYHTTEDDTGVWFCGSDQLEVWSEPEVSVISTNPGLSVYSWTAVMNQNFTFVCSVMRNIYKEDITFKRGDEKICTCRFGNITCETHKESTDNYRCKFVQTLLTGTSKLTTYSLTVSSISINDCKPWTCNTEKSKSNSITPTRLQTQANKINPSEAATTTTMSTLLETSGSRNEVCNENVIGAAVGSGSGILVLTLLVIGTIFICRRLKKGNGKDKHDYEKRTDPEPQSPTYENLPSEPGNNVERSASSEQHQYEVFGVDDNGPKY